MNYRVRQTPENIRKHDYSPLSSDIGWRFLKGNLHSEDRIICISLIKIMSNLLYFYQN